MIALTVVAGCGGGGSSSGADSSKTSTSKQSSSGSANDSGSNAVTFSPEDLDTLGAKLEEEGYEVGEPAEGIPHYTDGIAAAPIDTAPEGTVLIFLYTTAAEAKKAEPILKCEREEREVKKQLVEEGMMKNSDVTCLAGAEGGFASYIEGVPLTSSDKKAFSGTQEIIKGVVAELE